MKDLRAGDDACLMAVAGLVGEAAALLETDMYVRRMVDDVLRALGKMGGKWALVLKKGVLLDEEGRNVAHDGADFAAGSVRADLE